MNRGASPPLRFLALVVGGWMLFRAAAWIGWSDEAVDDGRRAAPVVLASAAPEPLPGNAALTPAHVEPLPPAYRFQREARGVRLSGESRTEAALTPPQTASAPAAAAPWPPPAHAPFAGIDVGSVPVRPPARRWSGSARLLVRQDSAAPTLAPGGSLGGSQVGARLLYRLNHDPARPFALAVRVSAPLRGRGAEAAFGLDWRPVERLPVYLLIERRQELDGGRSAFAASIHGGVSVALPAGARLDAYAQAGAVGMHSRDLFADGAARVALPLGPVEIGGGAWGAAQPDAAWFDIGPQVSLPLFVAGANLRLSADWRFRLAGDARPMSGPALTIGADF